MNNSYGAPPPPRKIVEVGAPVNPHTGGPVVQPGFNQKIEDLRIRDNFAGRAMAALLADVPRLERAADMNQTPFGDFVGQVAYEIADGMMKARKQRSHK